MVLRFRCTGLAAFSVPTSTGSFVSLPSQGDPELIHSKEARLPIMFEVKHPPWSKPKDIRYLSGIAAMFSSSLINDLSSSFE